MQACKDVERENCNGHQRPYLFFFRQNIAPIPRIAFTHKVPRVRYAEACFQHVFARGLTAHIGASYEGLADVQKSPAI